MINPTLAIPRPDMLYVGFVGIMGKLYKLYKETIDNVPTGANLVKWNKKNLMKIIDIFDDSYLDLYTALFKMVPDSDL